MRSPLSLARREALIRLLRRSVICGALVAGTVALLSACRQGRDDAGSETVSLSDLQAMVVPREWLRPFVNGLTISDRSGWRPNDAAAEDTIDPHDTGSSLSRSGRLGGYELTYSDPLGFASDDEERPLAVSTQVELFRDERSASAYLHHEADVVMRLRGRTLPEGKVAAAERFAGGDVGDEAEGVRATIKVDGFVGYTTAMAFRRGRMVASASLTQRVQTGGPADLRRIAAALDDRISRAVSGEIHGAPVKLPKARWWHAVPDLRALTLAGEELSAGARLVHRGYFRTPVSLAYVREYDTPRRRLGGSRITYLRTLTEAFKTTALARRSQRYMASARGSESIARRFVRKYFRRTDFQPPNVAGAPLPLGHGDTAAMTFSFDVPRGRFGGVMVSVRRGRLSAGVTVMGFDRHVRSEDVLALRGRLRARLAAA